MGYSSSCPPEHRARVRGLFILMAATALAGGCHGVKSAGTYHDGMANGSDGANNFPTPLERNGYAKLTSHADLMGYLADLDGASDVMEMSVIGRSSEGREIPALYFTLDERFGSRRDSKLLVLIYCQQHGNEPSGKEAALLLARRLTHSGKHLLRNLDLILIPQVNPDGAEAGARRNANGMDLNRNHAILSEPESQAVHDMFLKWMPEVTMDVHEYNASSRSWFSVGYMKDSEVAFDCVSNINIAPQIIRMSEDVLLPEIGSELKRKGVRFGRYTVGGPPGVRRIRHSTTDINDGRHSMGIYNTFSFIVEGKRFSDLVSNIERRTLTQAAALESFLEVMASHRKQVHATLSETRSRLKQPRGADDDDDEIAIRMDYFEDPKRPKIDLVVFDLYQWQHTQKRLAPYAPLVKATQQIKRPLGYIFPADEKKLLATLVRHQIEMKQLVADSQVMVQSYTIAKVSEVAEEDKTALDVEVEVTEGLRLMKKGSIVVTLDQAAANLIPLLLEPQSSLSLCGERSGRKYRIAEYLELGSEYPIHRIVASSGLRVESFDLQDHAR